MRGSHWGIAWVVLSFTCLPPAWADVDVLLRGGTIYDGTGQEPYVGDVAIENGKIAFLKARVTPRALQYIDCKGLIVCPGFIDVHNHSDAAILSPKTRGNVNFLLQGCTTVVTGNCGSGPTDAGKYLAKIDAQGAGTNIAHLLTHGTLRAEVMGSVNRVPTAEELKRMEQIAEKACKDGVFGMSTGLIYIPGTYSQTAEIAAIAKVVAQHDGVYASHIRDESKELLTAVEEALEIGRQSGARVHIAHFKSTGPEAWGLIRQAAAQIEAARKKGQIVTADQYPYIASSTSLQAMVIPSWALEGGADAFQKRLKDPTSAARIQEFVVKEIASRQGKAPLKLARYSPNQDWVGLSLEEIAERVKKSPDEVVMEIVRNGGAAAVSYGMNEEDVRFAMQLPWVATASDGGAYLPNEDKPHPRNYGTFPRKIGFYSIEEKVLPLAQAIRSATGLPAEIMKITDRGFIKPGLAADITVFDPQEFRDQATFADPHQYSKGVKYVFVNGVVAVYRGQPTGAQAGKALRKVQPANKAK